MLEQFITKLAFEDELEKLSKSTKKQKVGIGAGIVVTVGGLALLKRKKLKHLLKRKRSYAKIDPKVGDFDAYDFHIGDSPVGDFK